MKNNNTVVDNWDVEMISVIKHKKDVQFKDVVHIWMRRCAISEETTWAWSFSIIEHLINLVTLINPKQINGVSLFNKTSPNYHYSWNVAGLGCKNQHEELWASMCFSAIYLSEVKDIPGYVIE